MNISRHIEDRRRDSRHHFRDWGCLLSVDGFVDLGFSVHRVGHLVGGSAVVLSNDRPHARHPLLQLPNERTKNGRSYNSSVSPEKIDEKPLNFWGIRKQQRKAFDNPGIAVLLRDPPVMRAQAGKRRKSGVGYPKYE
jgi:hypothetical protein